MIALKRWQCADERMICTLRRWGGETPRRRKESRRGGGAAAAPPQWAALAVADEEEEDGDEMLRIRSGDVEWVEQISDSDSSEDIIAAF